ncbi:MAG: CYTH domain-containing protein [Deltaproteobacteria bacterium]|nr:CYTH domain-containing protein [Deltaproteobacteria bacterium]
MGQEIEAKFTITSDGWRGQGRAVEIKQGYLSTTKERTVRVRLKGDKAFLTIKGAPDGIVRREFEYSIPVDDARTMLAELCEGTIIDKTRYVVDHEGATWEIDAFHGDNDGLLFAELEVDSIATFERVLAEHKPPWIGERLDDARYTNAELARHPFSLWSNKLSPEGDLSPEQDLSPEEK